MARVLLVDPSPASRLLAIAALSGEHQVQSGDDAAEPLRALRRNPVDVVLLAPELGGEHRAQLVRAIRTDAPGRPSPRIGILSRPGDGVGPDEALGGWAADGWLGEPARLPEFVRLLLLGPLPVRLGEHRPSLAARIARRVRSLGQ